MKNYRIHFLYVVVFLSFIAIIWRVAFLQIFKYDFYSAMASDQYQFKENIVPERGMIYACGLQENELYPLAVNYQFPMVYAVPREIDNPVETAAKLGEILQMDKTVLEQKLSKTDDPYESLKRKISEQEESLLKDADLKGIYTVDKNWRYYSENELAAHILGFVNFDGDGQYGLEGYYDQNLRGNNGFLEAEKDTFGRWIPLGVKNIMPAADGDDLILTIDRNIQFIAEEKLKELSALFKIEKGTVIAMDVNTGAIKALANYPSYNPNSFGEIENMNVYLNSAVHDLYEPGSVFKVITMAAGLETGKIAPDTTYEDIGYEVVGGYVIRNALKTGNGIQTMTNVLEKSLNTGSIFVEKKVGKEDFKYYVEKFGFGEKTGIDLGGEVEGNISSLNVNSDVNYATASFGQGIAVTPLEMISAISAIANGGDLMKPFIVQQKNHQDGSVEKTEPQVIRNVISQQAASRLISMMTSVVENGHSQKAQLERYYVAGKTGTAQVPIPGGYGEETIHTFIGFLPATAPQYAILIKIDKPQGAQYADQTITPVFHDIADFLMNYYHIKPDKQ